MGDFTTTQENKLSRKNKKPLRVNVEAGGILNEYGELAYSFKDIFKPFDDKDVIISIQESIKEEVEEEE